MNTSALDSQLKPKESHTETAKQIAADLLGESITNISPITKKGMVNEVFIAETKDKKVVVRMNNERNSLDQFKKEAWCMDQAAQRGVRGAKVLSLGQREDQSFIVQSFLAGHDGGDAVVKREHTSRRLGEYARIIHSISAEGFGDHMSAAKPGHFDGSWENHIIYNIESLGSDDKLIELAVLNTQRQAVVRSLFEQLKNTKLDFGLNHGDISLKNTIVNADDVWLIDWGSAELNVVPHLDFVGVMGWSENSTQPSQIDLDSFLEGYGISADDFQAMEKELRIFALLRDFDKLRWAIDRKPEKVPPYVIRAQKALEKAITTE